MATWMRANIGLGNGLLLDGTKPSTETLLTQFCFHVTPRNITKYYNHRKCARYADKKCHSKLFIQGFLFILSGNNYLTININRVAIYLLPGSFQLFRQSHHTLGPRMGCSRAVLNKNRTSTHGARTGPVRRRTNFAFPYGARRVLMHAL